MYTELRTQRLLMRPLDVCDLETTHAYAGDKESTKYMIALPNETLEETRELLEQASAEWRKNEPQFYEFAVVLNGLHIGGVSITLDETRREGELGWILHKDYWKKGYATEAARAVKDFAINDLHVSRLIAHCDSRNTASRRVMERLGMTLLSGDGIRYNRSSPEAAKELLYGLDIGEA